MKRAVPTERVEQMLAGVRSVGLKLTPQRMAIVQELAADETHPTAQELFERLRPSLPTMSFATVYNTLDALSSAGLCSAMSLSPGAGRFDPNMGPHHHLVCDVCGSVRDIFPTDQLVSKPPSALRASSAGGVLGAQRSPAEAHAKVVAKVAPGFELRSVEQIFRGVCASCAKGEGRTG